MELSKTKHVKAGDTILCFWCTYPMDVVERNGKLYVDHILECALPDHKAIREQEEAVERIENHI